MRGRAWALALLAAVLVVLAFVLPPFAQPQGYHDFADRRAWLGIPNYGNVASNIMFLVAGLAGLFAMRTPAVRAMDAAPRHAYALMFLGLVFTAFGSGFYHWAPSDGRLVWDRLPMTVVFMPLLAATYAERLRWRSDGSLIVLTLLGLGSVIYWACSGNLMPYLVAQGGSILLILLALALLPTPWTQRHRLWLALACYAVALGCEKLDLALFQATAGVISGHTLKHLAAAAAFFFVVQMLRRQQPKRDRH
ncbi:ceramidase domain-containing protein [Dyella jejuensis]